MRIGLLAYSTDTGLGYQTWDFAKNITCEAILVCDLSKLNGMTTHHERFKNLANQVRICHGFPTEEDMRWLCVHSQVIFTCETPLKYELYDFAREYKVKTVLQPNYEFLNYFRDGSLPKPDILALPSMWNADRINTLRIPTTYLPVPFPEVQVPSGGSGGTRTFTHITGRPAVYDRNGAMQFLNACLMIGDRFHYEIFIQAPKEHNAEKTFHEIKSTLDFAKSQLGDNLTVHFDVPNNNEMYKGDVLVLPRKYGGLCLPMQEGLSHGLPVIMPKISPNDTVLPHEWLVDAFEVGNLETHSKIPIYSVDVVDLANKMLEVMANVDDYSKWAIDLAEKHSWKRMRPKYHALFKRLCS